jgi:hypothetical protein
MVISCLQPRAYIAYGYSPELLRPKLLLSPFTYDLFLSRETINEASKCKVNIFKTWLNIILQAAGLKAAYWDIII